MSTVSELLSEETLSLIETKARRLGLSLDDYLLRLLPADVKEVALRSGGQNDDFEADMAEFAGRTAGLPQALSREDIYFDHD